MLCTCILVKNQLIDTAFYSNIVSYVYTKHHALVQWSHIIRNCKQKQTNLSLFFQTEISFHWDMRGLRSITFLRELRYDWVVSRLFSDKSVRYFLFKLTFRDSVHITCIHRQNTWHLTILYKEQRNIRKKRAYAVVEA